MTHSSHSARQAAINSFAFETALSSLIMDEKEYLSALDPSDPLFDAKFTPRFSLLTTLEAYRRELLMGVDSGFCEAERRDLEALVRDRVADSLDDGGESDPLV